MCVKSDTDRMRRLPCLMMSDGHVIMSYDVGSRTIVFTSWSDVIILTMFWHAIISQT